MVFKEGIGAFYHAAAARAFERARGRGARSCRKRIRCWKQRA
ncbi:Hypothetical protein A7982_00869 [Minicystis rosea]|nr:Hypothetical protein A7982_00869 [Minicystis rosea]